MNVFNDRNSLTEAIKLLKSEGLTVGFVPTMGALHEGHLSLVERAFQEVDSVVVSIFVNPTQFNNSTDLASYPRMLEKDIQLLQSAGNVLIFTPNVAEIYPETDTFSPLDLDGIDTVLEGKFRPGHFQGVVHVLRNLFEIVQADKAYFGWKDFQQVAVIKKMVDKLNIPIEIVPCETARSPVGLALSSRNLRLTEEQKSDALILFNTFQFLESIKETYSPSEAQRLSTDFFNRGNLRLEYLAIVDSTTLQELTTTWVKGATCCIAAFCGEVRLIDNWQF